MKCYTVNGSLREGIDLNSGYDLLLGRRGPDCWEERVSLCRHRPANGYHRTVITATPKHVVPLGRDGFQPRPFWVLEESRDERSEVLVLLCCKSWELVSGRCELVIEGWHRQGRESLIRLSGVIKVATEEGGVAYLVFEPGDRTLKALSQDAYDSRERTRLEAEEERKRQQEERERLYREEQARWTRRCEEVAVVKVSRFRFVHHSGVNRLGYAYRPTNTYIEVTLAGDSKPARTISVDDFVRERAGWKLITARREDALRAALPKQFTLRGERRYEQRDTGENRNEEVWYTIDQAELETWVARAIASIK